MTRIRPVVASVVAWSVGAATAIGVGLVALSSIGTAIADRPVQPLAGTGPTSAVTPTPDAAAPSSSATASASASDQTIKSAGGTVIARCLPGGAYLVGWSPAPGYHAEDLRRGPAATARVKFEGSAREVTVTVRCTGGVAQPSIQDEAREEHG